MGGSRHDVGGSSVARAVRAEDEAPSRDEGLRAATALATSTPESRWLRSGSVLRCARERHVFEAGGLSRVVLHQRPLGTPPPAGWPVVILFQPSLYWAEAHWTGFTDIFGQRIPAETIRGLLDAGYAVLTPQAQRLGNAVWETNVPFVNADWQRTYDHALMLRLFADIEAGVYGPLDPRAMFATGMSSGGYMTSRMALSYPGRFRALAIQSAAWATFVGPLCSVRFGLARQPATLPDDHPPTLFLHGANDQLVPVATMHRYADALDTRGFTTRRVVVPGGHEFLPPTPTEVLAWFDAHRPAYP